ncbi:MAG: GTPase Era [Lachnospiraceae bacterium]|jgi:GTP-binding protein Era|nr:GTPase Era [Lachnospiraceae bacterium]MEE3462058.1 GTPase Era [Lachnospiraceae bacterium]
MTRSGFVSLIGKPNAGKSTLMNYIVGMKIAITSAKPQTTRNRIETVYTDENGQIIFLDTPGIHKAKNRLGQYMDKVAFQASKDVDIVVWLVEPTTRISQNEEMIAENLKNTDKPVFLVINKIDTVKPAVILEVIETYKKLLDFSEIIPVSALKGTNVDDLKETIFKYLPEGPLYFDPDTVTDQPERQIVAELIREKALFDLDDEIPHGIAVVVEKMHERKRRGQEDQSSYSKEEKPEKPDTGYLDDSTVVDINAVIVCERESHKGIIIGKHGSMLKKIGSEARKDIEDLLGCRVNLKLWVKVRDKWRDSDIMMKNFGYDMKEVRIDEK